MDVLLREFSEKAKLELTFIKIKKRLVQQKAYILSSAFT
jgi:hypothetical protein